MKKVRKLYELALYIYLICLQVRVNFITQYCRKKVHPIDVQGLITSDVQKGTHNT